MVKNECEYVKQQKKKENVNKYIFGIIMIVILTICICNGTLFIPLKNTQNQFDNAIMWSAIGAIGSIAAFVGVIATIRYTEKSRIQQNQVDYEKEKLLTEQIEFKHVLKKQLEILNPVNIILDSNYVNNLNYQKIHQDIITYISKLNLIELELYWYYDKTIIENYVEFSKFINSIKDYKERIKNKLDEYINTLEIFQTADRVRLYKQLDPLNLLTEEQKSEYEKIKNINIDFELNQMYVKRTHIMREITSIVDLTLAHLYEDAKVVIEERNKAIQNKIKK